MLRPTPLPPSLLAALFPFHRDVKNVETWSGTVHMRIQVKEMKIFFMRETSNVFAHRLYLRVRCRIGEARNFESRRLRSEAAERGFFPSLPAVMNGVKRSETRVLALSLSRCAPRVSFAAAGDAI